MAHAIRSKQVRSPVAEQTHPKPRLVRALKSVTTSPTAQSFEARRGFTYYVVQVVYAEAGLKQTYSGVLDKSTALEFKAILEPEVGGRYTCLEIGFIDRVARAAMVGLRALRDGVEQFEPTERESDK